MPTLCPYRSLHIVEAGDKRVANPKQKQTRISVGQHSFPRRQVGAAEEMQFALALIQDSRLLEACPFRLDMPSRNHHLCSPVI
jgi:hypothetical protein